MDNDPTYENYLALLGAILIDEDHENYKDIVYNKRLFDKKAEKKRIKEIDELRARGEKTELEIWYKNTMSKSKQAKNERGKRLLQKIARMRQEERKKQQELLFETFKEHLVDMDKIDTYDIARYKVKIINIKTKEIIVCNREECCKITGMERRIITTYIKKRRLYKGTYLLSIADEKVSIEEFKKIRHNSVRIKATNVITNEEKIFFSFKEISNFFNVNYITFQKNFRYRKMRYI